MERRPAKLRAGRKDVAKLREWTTLALQRLHRRLDDDGERVADWELTLIAFSVDRRWIVEIQRFR